MRVIEEGQVELLEWEPVGLSLEARHLHDLGSPARSPSETSQEARDEARRDEVCWGTTACRSDDSTDSPQPGQSSMHAPA